MQAKQQHLLQDYLLELLEDIGVSNNANINTNDNSNRVARGQTQSDLSRKKNESKASLTVADESLPSGNQQSASLLLQASTAALLAEIPDVLQEQLVPEESEAEALPVLEQLSEIVVPEVSSSSPTENDIEPVNTDEQSPKIKLPGPPLFEPAWREQGFQALLFQAGELYLSAPLTMLNRVQPLSDITPIYANPAFMGLMTAALGYQIRVVDTLALLMPEQALSDEDKHYSHVIVAEGCDWGLAVSRICDSVTLEPGAVQWRGGQGTRPWFAGIVKKQMCGLLDFFELDKKLSAL